MGNDGVLIAQEASFLSDGVDLKKLHSQLAKFSKQAIDALLKCLESKDEQLRFRAACKLLDYQVTVAKEISTDQMNRLIAEVRLKRNPQGRIGSNPSGDDDSDVPQVDFSKVREL